MKEKGIVKVVCIYTLFIYFLELNNSRRRIEIGANYAVGDNWGVGFDYSTAGFLFILQLIIVAMAAYNFGLMLMKKEPKTFMTIVLISISVLTGVNKLQQIFINQFMFSFTDWHLLASSVLLLFFLVVKERHSIIIQLSVISLYSISMLGLYYAMEGRFEREVHPNIAEYVTENGLNYEDSKAKGMGNDYLNERKLNKEPQHFEKNPCEEIRNDLQSKQFNEELSFGNLEIGSFSVNEKWGIVTSKGEIIKAPFADELEFFNPEIGTFCLNGKWGLVDNEGEIIKEPFAARIIFTENRIGSFCINGKWGIINSEGEIIKEPFAEMVYFQSNQIGTFKEENKEGFVNNRGEIMKKPFADNIELLSEGYYSYQIDNKIGIIQQDLRIIRYPFAQVLRKSDYSGFFYAESDKYFSSLVDLDGNIAAGWQNNLLRVDRLTER